MKDRSKRKLAVDFVQAALQLREKSPSAAFFLAEDRFSAILIGCAEEISSSVSLEKKVGEETSEAVDVESDWVILKAALAAAARGSEPGSTMFDFCFFIFMFN